jgi:hypothetical protein
VAVDLGAMAYMLDQHRLIAPITWAAAAYFGVRAGLWTRRASLAGRTELVAGLSPSMAVMMLGMAFMFASMQLMR